MPAKEYLIPLGKARKVTEGKDVTLIAYGAMVRECEQAIAALEGKVSIELLDLRTVSPLDVDSIIASVKKTGRAVVVHEAQKQGGVAAEIIALINEHAIFDLKAPVLRVTGPHTIVPLPKLEDEYMVDEKKIALAIEKVMRL